MTDDPRFKSIPAGKDYPGMLKHHLGGERCLQVVGWGEEAERVLAEAVAAREVSALKNRPPLIEGD
jgi:hypothetical protein